jgi:hypothetical protein
VPSNGVNASDLDVPSVDGSPDDVESLRLAQNGSLIRSSILARAANEALP